MAKPETIPCEALLAPIPGDAPAGASLRADSSAGSLYYAIKDARAAARAAERSALQLGDLEATAAVDWGPVLELAPRILSEKAKDLEVTAWFAEALVRRHGFAGLRDAFKLARGLVERYWDGLHPLPDEDGISTRTAPLTGLNGDDSEGTLIVPIALVPLTERTEAGQYSTWHYQRAGELARLTDPTQREQRIAAGSVPLERIQAAVSASAVAFLRDTAEDLEQCRAEFQALCKALDGRIGQEAPPSSNISAALDRAHEAFQFLAKGALSAGPADAATEVPASGAGAQPGGAPARAGGPVQTRDEALRALTQIAEFFRRSEPHSPVSFAVERAVRWAGLPLPALVEELIPDMSARNEFYKLTGIQPPSTS